jgi:hypothetical protein
MSRNSRNYEKITDLKSWKYSRNSSLWWQLRLPRQNTNLAIPKKPSTDVMRWRPGKCENFLVSRDFHTQMLHGAGIFTYPLVMADIAMV